jgi:hypothetical protein
MTMGLHVKNADMFDLVKRADKVRFCAEQVTECNARKPGHNGALVVTEIAFGRCCR